MSTQSKPWRDVLPVHPAAELLPLMNESELRELGNDIKKHGLKTSVAVWFDPLSDERQHFLLDGRNRLDAMEMVGLPVVGDDGGLLAKAEVIDNVTDPYAFVLSTNLHRRHLTPEQRREMIAKVIEANPQRSDRQIGQQVKADHKTVGSIRKQAEVVGRVPHVASRNDTRGRIQPAHKSKQTSIPMAASSLPARIVKKFGDGSEVPVGKIASKVLGNVASSYVVDLMEKLAADPSHGYRVEKVSGFGNDASWRVAKVEEATVQPIEPANAERRAELEQEQAGPILAVPDKKYGVILANPDWSFGPRSHETGMDRAADNHYPTLTTHVIAARDVHSIAAADCILFLWATVPMLLHALRLMTAWGFQYCDHLIWDKELGGTGYWFINQHEILLVGTKGEPVAPSPGTQAPSILREKCGEYSAKPEAVVQMIERLWPDIPKIELDRHGPARPGWGNLASPTEDSPARADADVPSVAKQERLTPSRNLDIDHVDELRDPPDLTRATDVESIINT